MAEDIGNICNLSAEQAQALVTLYADPEIDRELSGIAFRFRGHGDKDDLRQELALRLATGGYELRDVKCLKSWCFVTAMNLCRNGYRHDKVVRRYCERCAGENVESRRRGGAVVIQRSEVKTPEQEMLEQEQDERLQTGLDNIIGSLPKDMQMIAKLWGEGKPPAEIAKAAGKSVPTVYRKLKAVQQIITARMAVLDAEADE
jgi:RNA polymerase sigma factor (sigma-70 family)